MKNEYQVRKHPECVDGSRVDLTIHREDLVNMLGFSAAVNGDGACNDSRPAEAPEGIQGDSQKACLLGSG
jgi:hypothetical protein